MLASCNLHETKLMYCSSSISPLGVPWTVTQTSCVTVLFTYVDLGCRFEPAGGDERVMAGLREAASSHRTAPLEIRRKRLPPRHGPRRAAPASPASALRAAAFCKSAPARRLQRCKRCARD